MRHRIRDAGFQLVALVSDAAGRFLAAANHDFCPWANRYVYWLKQPIGWFIVGAIAAGLVGACLAPQAWVVCGVLLLVTLLGIAWPWIALRGVSAEIGFERRRCREQDSTLVTLTVTNRWPCPVWGLLVQGGFCESDKATTALTHLRGWSKSQFQFPFIPLRRGVYPVEAPRLATGFPFGLWTLQRRIAVGQSLIVWPRCIDLKSLPLLEGDLNAVVGGCIDRAGSDGDILSARHYRAGDSPRRIHWAHTAKRDMLIVCERQTVARRRVVVALDALPFGTPGPGSRELLDWSVRIVASLCREFHVHTCELSCELDGERHPVLPTPTGLHQLLDRLAGYEPSMGGRQNHRVVAAPGQLTILVTTVAGWRAATGKEGNRINIARRTGGGLLRSVLVGQSTSELNDAPPAWMRLDVSRDLAQQLRHQWERQCHDDWRIH